MNQMQKTMTPLFSCINRQRIVTRCSAFFAAMKPNLIGALIREERRKADGKPDMEFADKDVGWMIVYHTMTYTTNGGKSWTTRQINFPANVNAFSLVQRDRGYAVGDHGMIYKYRIVPVDYTVKGMLPAPSM
jgi:hypothetical protein